MILDISAEKALRYFLLIFVFGVLARSYGITDHWKNNDHYNFGGAMTTHALQCLRSTPKEISRGLIITECDTEKPNIYVNYTPFYLYGVWLTTEIFGTGEWAHRLFFLIFSSLNILLVYLIAKEVWPKNPRRWLLAAFFQSFFLSPMYLGTHMDPITEFTVTPMLLSSLWALRGRMLGACLWAIVAGLTTWIGYFQFLPLLLYSWKTRKHLAVTIGVCAVAVVVCFGSMMFLRNTWNIFDFVFQKLTDPEYIRPPTLAERLRLPFEFIRNFFQSLARLLGPLFAGFALYEFFFGEGRKLWKLRNLEKEHWAYILTGLAFFGYLVPGFKYAMVHIHNYIFAIPMWALLGATFVDSVLTHRELAKKPLVFLLLVVTASYPFGIFQSSRAHDVFNSVLFVLSVLVFLTLLLKNTLKPSWLVALVIVTALTNFSQVMNYRNEADTEFPFCEWAREEYARTGQPVHTQVRRTRTKVFLYCRGIPIVFEGPEQGI